MTRPVFLAEDLVPYADDLGVGDLARLQGAEGRHAATVRRIATGEILDVVDGRGLRLTCEVLASDRDGLDLRVVGSAREEEPRPRLVLVQALAKGGRDEQAVESATEIGVDGVIPWQADRSIVRWPASKAARGRAKWQSVVRAAAKQSRRSRIPDVGEVLDTRGLVGTVRRLVDEGGAALVCHEEGERSLAAWGERQWERLRGCAEVALVVGPEGGISPEELDALREAGAEVVLLGPHVLRSANAGPAAAVLLSAALHRW